MSNSIVPFNFEEHQVRVVAIDGEPWFVLADLCKVLEIVNVGNAAARLDDELKGVHSADTLGGRQDVTVVSEPGMYEVVLLSRKPEAKAFKRWITSEVLPTIRKTGSFGVAPALSEQEIVHQALQITVRQVKELEAKVAEDATKVEYVDTYVADSDLRLFRNVAKSLGMTEGELRSDLLERGWIYAEHASRWSESKGHKEMVARYSPYSHKAQYFEPVPVHTAPRFKGEVMHTLKITPEGAVAIARLYGKHLQAVA